MNKIIKTSNINRPNPYYIAYLSFGHKDRVKTVLLCNIEVHENTYKEGR